MKKIALTLTVFVLGATGCATRIVPSLRVIDSATPEDFVGAWTGVAVDRPHEGNQHMTMILEIHAVSSPGGWKATLDGEIVDDIEEEVGGLSVRGNKLVFRLPAKDRSTGPFWPMDIWLGFASPEKDTLLGVGLPAPARGWEEKEDSFSIELKR